MLLVLLFCLAFLGNICAAGPTSSGDVLHGQVFNLMDDIEEFYSHQFSEELGTFSKASLINVVFSPSSLDFCSSSLFVPKHMEVSITNLHTDLSFEIIATFGRHESFFWSAFNSTSLQPLKSAAMNITFIPQKSGLMEDTIFIATSRGLLRYPVFGSGIVSQEHVIPIVHLLADKDTQLSAVTEVFNPSVFPVKVEHLVSFAPQRGIIDTLDPYFTISNESRRLIIGFNRFPTLYPHRSAEVFKYRFPISNLSTMRSFILFSVRSTELEIPLCQNFPHSISCSTFNTSKDLLPTVIAVALHTRYTTVSELFPKSSLLHFGTVSEDTGSVNFSFDLISSSQQTIVITNVVADTFDPALTIRVVNHDVIPGIVGPQTVAILTLSVANISHSYVSSGFITAYTEDNSLVKVPYYAILIRGRLILRVANSTDRRTGLLYQYFLYNNADLPLLVLQPQLPKSMIDVTVIRNHTGTIVLQPSEECLLLQLYVSDRRTVHVSDSFSVVTNVTALSVPVEAFSGLVHVLIPSARFVDGVFDLGHTILGSERTTSIILSNLNSFQVSVEYFLLTTSTEDHSLTALLSSECTSSCVLSAIDQTCIACLQHINEYSNLTYSIRWGGQEKTGEVTGFFVLQTNYERLVYHFRFYVSLGEVTLTPNPIVFSELFPGKIVRQNLIAVNNYARATRLSHLRLVDESGTIPASLRLLHAFETNSNIVSNRTTLNLSNLVLHSHQPTRVACLQFDLSVDCRDVVVSSTELSDLPNVVDPDTCYTGFNMDSPAGRSFLLTMVVNRTSPNRLDSFLDGLLISARLYARLQSAWATKQTNSLSHLPSIRSTTYVAFGVTSEDHIRFWNDLNLSYIWPRLISNNRPFAQSTGCTMGESLPPRFSSFAPYLFRVGQALRLHFPKTVWTETVHCDLLIRNPSDRPLLIQPFLLDAIYDVGRNYSTVQPDDPLVSFLHTLGLSVSPDSLAKLSKLFTGSFSIRIVNTSSYYEAFVGSLGEDVLALECCPLLILSPRVGQVTLRLSFTPNDDLTVHSLSSESAYNLLFIRNNLTALEPIWLTARLAKATLAVGLMSTGLPSFTVVSNGASTIGRTVPFCNNESTGTVHFIFEAVWTRNSAYTHENRNQSSPEWLLSTRPPAVTAPTLHFSFTEDWIMPFYTRTSDPFLPYSMLDTSTHSDSVDRQFADSVLHNHGQSIKSLSTLAIRRFLVLFNIGDVPLVLHSLILGPDSPGFPVNPQIVDGELTSSNSPVCFHSGFLLSPCLLLSTRQTANVHNGPKPSPVLIQPGDNLPVELLYLPDFVRTTSSVKLWFIAYPQRKSYVDSVEPSLMACDFQISGAMCSEALTRNATFMSLQASFPLSFLKSCVKALPRPWLESHLWNAIVVLLTASLLSVVFIGHVDAHRIYATHLKAREIINLLPFNAVPDPSRIFSFERLAHGTLFILPATSSNTTAASQVQVPSCGEQSVLKEEFVDTPDSRCCPSSVSAPLHPSVKPALIKLLFEIPFFIVNASLFVIKKLFCSESKSVCCGRSPKNEPFSSVGQEASASLSKSSATWKLVKKNGCCTMNQIAPQPIIYPVTVQGDSDGDSGNNSPLPSKIHVQSKCTLATPEQPKPLNRYIRHSFSGRRPGLPLRSSARRKKLNKSDNTLASDSQDADSKVVRDASSVQNSVPVESCTRSSTVRNKFGDVSMTEAQIAAAVRATMELAQQSTLRAHKKIALTKQNAVEKSSTCCSSTSSSGGDQYFTKCGTDNVKCDESRPSFVATQYGNRSSTFRHHSSLISNHSGLQNHDVPQKSHSGSKGSSESASDSLYGLTINTSPISIQRQFKLHWPSSHTTDSHYNSWMHSDVDLSYVPCWNESTVTSPWNSELLSWPDPLLPSNNSPDCVISGMDPQEIPTRTADPQAFTESRGHLLPQSIQPSYNGMGSVQPTYMMPTRVSESHFATSYTHGVQAGSANCVELSSSGDISSLRCSPSVVATTFPEADLVELTACNSSNDAVAATTQAHLHLTCTTNGFSNAISHTCFTESGDNIHDELGHVNLPSSDVEVFAVPHPRPEPVYFFELPQIIHVMRSRMLEHERRMRSVDDLSFTSDIDEMKHLITCTLEESTDTGPTVSSDTAVNLQLGSFLTDLSASSLCTPEAPSQLLKPASQCGSQPTSMEASSLNEDILRNSYQSWKSMDAVSIVDLLHDLGLEETDRLLSFGPSFSYLRPCDEDPFLMWSLPLTDGTSPTT